MSRTRHVRSQGGGAEEPHEGRSGLGRGLLSVEQVAKHLGVPVKSVYGYVHQHGLRAAKVGRHLRVDPADLESWLETRTLSHEARSGSAPSGLPRQARRR